MNIPRPLNLKLTAELVPESCFYSNWRTAVSGDNWDIIRKRAYADAKMQCAGCGTASKLNCHEVWEYDDEFLTQTLRGFTALCDSCHHVKHLDFTQILSAKGQLDYMDVVAHFCRVNKCTISDFRKHEAAAFKQWRERSAKQWKTDLGQWKYLVLLEQLPKRTNSISPNPAKRPDNKRKRIVEVSLERDINL